METKISPLTPRLNFVKATVRDLLDYFGEERRLKPTLRRAAFNFPNQQIFRRTGSSEKAGDGKAAAGRLPSKTLAGSSNV